MSGNEMRLVDQDGTPIGTSVIDGKRAWVTQSQVTVESTLAKDNRADQWILIDNIGNDGDTIRYQIEGGTSGDVTITKTALETTRPLLAAKIVSTLNQDATFRTKWIAFNFNEVVHISAIADGDFFSAPNTNDVLITVTGSIAFSYETGDQDKIITRNKVALGTRDPTDPRIAVLGVQGEVSSVLKSTNPIDFDVVKIINTQDEQLFIDETIPIDERWFIPDIFFGSANATQLKIYKGIERGRQETWVYSGAHSLDYEAVPKPAGNWTATVDGVPNTGFTVTDDPNDNKKSLFTYTGAGNIDGSTVVITYDAVDRILSPFALGNDSKTIAKQVPIRLEPEAFIIATIKNKSSNSALTQVTLSGYYEEVIL